MPTPRRAGRRAGDAERRRRDAEGGRLRVDLSEGALHVLATTRPGRPRRRELPADAEARRRLDDERRPLGAGELHPMAGRVDVTNDWRTFFLLRRPRHGEKINVRTPYAEWTAYYYQDGIDGLLRENDKGNYIEVEEYIDMLEWRRLEE